MHEVLGEQDAEVAADRAGGGLAWVGRAHHRAHDLPGVLRALDHHRDDRAAAHERDEIVVEALADVLLVVPGEGVGVERAQVHGDDRQVLGLEAGDDLADEPALDGVGLQQDESAIRHGRRRYRRSSRMRGA